MSDCRRRKERAHGSSYLSQERITVSALPVKYYCSPVRVLRPQRDARLIASSEVRRATTHRLVRRTCSLARLDEAWRHVASYSLHAGFSPTHTSDRPPCVAGSRPSMRSAVRAHAQGRCVARNWVDFSSLARNVEKRNVRCNRLTDAIESRAHLTLRAEYPVLSPLSVRAAAQRRQLCAP